MQEKHTRDVLKDHLKGVLNTQAELKTVCHKIVDVQAKIKQTHERQDQLLATHGNKWVQGQFVPVVVFIGQCLF